MSADTLSVGYSVKTSEGPGVFAGAGLAALASEPVPHAANDAHPQSLRVEAEADGLDLDAMEHNRQSRLQRWQEQRGTHG